MKKLLSLLMLMVIFPIVTKAYECSQYEMGFNNGTTDTCFGSQGSSQYAKVLDEDGTVYLNYDVQQLLLSAEKGKNITIDLNGHDVEYLKLSGCDQYIEEYTVINSSDIESSVNDIELGCYSGPILDEWNDITTYGTTDADSRKMIINMNNIKINGELYIKPDAKVVLNDCFTDELSGTITSNLFTNYGKLIINSGDYNISKRMVNYNDLEIKGGSFAGNVLINQDFKVNVLHPESCLWNPTVTTTITGGSFTANNSDNKNYLLLNEAYNGDTAKAVLNINGGSYRSTKNDYIFSNTNGTVNVGGGQTKSVKSPLFYSKNGIVKMTGGTYATDTTAKAIDFENSTFNFTNGTIDAKNSSSMSFSIFNFGNTTSSQPILYLNSGTLGLSDDYPMRWKSGVIYLPNDSIKNDENVELTSDNYEIRSKRQSDGSYINFIALKSDPATYFPSGITDDPYSGGSQNQDPSSDYASGDWNHDGVVDAVDLSNYRKFLSGDPIVTSAYVQHIHVVPEWVSALDIDNSGEINLVDLVKARAIVAD